jgi:hypothetical protein
MRNFVVTATPRSGTTFTSVVLSRMGCRCGHEQVFQPWKPWGFHGWGEFDGDASCYAVPYLYQLPRDTLVVHQVRDPLATIRSLANWGLFSPFSIRRHIVLPIARFTRGKPPRELALRFMKVHSRDAWRRRDGDIARAAQHWVDWNRAIERQSQEMGLEYVRFRVEDLRGAKLLELADSISVHPSTLPDDLPGPLNAGRLSSFTDVSPDDLPADLRSEVGVLAGSYGYEFNVMVR